MYKIEVMFQLNGGPYFQFLCYNFDTEKDAQQFMNDARKEGWIWPENAIIWKDNS